MPRTTRTRRPLIVHSVWLQAKYETEEVLVWYRGRRRRRFRALILNTMRLGEDKVIVCLVSLEKMRVLVLFRVAMGIYSYLHQVTQQIRLQYGTYCKVCFTRVVPAFWMYFIGPIIHQTKTYLTFAPTLQGRKRTYSRFKWNLFVRIGQPSKFKLNNI